MLPCPASTCASAHDRSGCRWEALGGSVAAHDPFPARQVPSAVSRMAPSTLTRPSASCGGSSPTPQGRETSRRSAMRAWMTSDRILVELEDGLAVLLEGQVGFTASMLGHVWSVRPSPISVGAVTATCEPTEPPASSPSSLAGGPPAHLAGLRDDSDSDDAGGSGGSLPPGDVESPPTNIAWSHRRAPGPSRHRLHDRGRQPGLGRPAQPWTSGHRLQTELEAGVSAQVLQINLPAGESTTTSATCTRTPGTLTVS